MATIFKKIFELKFFLLILILGGVLRFMNLGYSDFQGDEIKALFLPESNQNILNYLLDQRKGPIQFGITYLLKFADPLYRNQFLLRLPFALAGFISIYYFYKLVKEIFDEKIAFYASFFFITTGFLVAFSRIIQYQSFVIMFMLGSLYYLKKEKIYLGLIFWALSILSHYDGVFIFPLVFYYLYIYLTNISKDSYFSIGKLQINKKHFLHLIVSGLLALSLLLAFYIPFVMNISKATQDYWAGRITGEVSVKKSSSIYLFSVYQPIYVIKIYFALFGLGALTLILKELSFKKLQINSSFIKINRGELNSLILWFLIPLIFMEIFVSIPGTHIYTYIIPVTIILGFGITLIESIFSKAKWLFYTGVFIIFTFIYLQSYYIFIDNYREYPWENEKFLIWTLAKPSASYHLSMFGFPYFRDWEGIQDFINSYPIKQVAYSTNERVTISRYYIDLDKSSDKAGFFIHIMNPQSFEEIVPYEKPAHYVNNYKPIYVLNRNGRDLVNMYLMEPGTKEEILERNLKN